MRTYTAFFYTEAEWARTTIEADTPELALQRAREIEANETEALDFQHYDSTAGVERIDIRPIEILSDEVAQWLSDDLKLRLAADDLLAALEQQTEAAESVLDRWSHGDLAGAVRDLGATVSVARTAIAKAKGGAA